MTNSRIVRIVLILAVWLLLALLAPTPVDAPTVAATATPGWEAHSGN